MKSFTIMEFGLIVLLIASWIVGDKIQACLYICTFIIVRETKRNNNARSNSRTINNSCISRDSGRYFALRYKEVDK